MTVWAARTVRVVRTTDDWPDRKKKPATQIAWRASVLCGADMAPWWRISAVSLSVMCCQQASSATALTLAFGQFDQAIQMQDMHLAGTNIDQPLGLEAGQDTADGFDGQPQIVADIGACHR